MKSGFTLLGLFLTVLAQGYEQHYIVSNGQGVSSPSFSDGLSGENPAGLVFNQSFKVQGNVATFDGGFNHPEGSGAVLVGNGLLGAGLEYTKFGRSPYNEGQINWGIAGRLNALSIGVSGHHPTDGADERFDVGILLESTPRMRWGFLVPDFTHGLHQVAAGITYTMSAMADWVVDAAYQLNLETLVLKPGITLRLSSLQLTGAYGFRVAGSGETLLLREFTGGVGLKLTQNLLLGYEYKGLPEHRLGLTLRLN